MNRLEITDINNLNKGCKIFLDKNWYNGFKFDRYVYDFPRQMMYFEAEDDPLVKLKVILIYVHEIKEYRIKKESIYKIVDGKKVYCEYRDMPSNVDYSFDNKVFCVSYENAEGFFHRLTGPAYIRLGGLRSNTVNYYIDGEKMSEEDFYNDLRVLVKKG